MVTHSFLYGDGLGRMVTRTPDTRSTFGEAPWGLEIYFYQIHPNFSRDILKLLITSVALRKCLLLLSNPNEKKKGGIREVSCRERLTETCQVTKLSWVS